MIYKHLKKIYPLIMLLSSQAFSNTNSIDFAFNNQMLSAKATTLFDQSNFKLSATFDKRTDKGDMFNITAYKIHEVDIHQFGFGLKNVNAWFDTSWNANSHAFAVYGQYSLEIVHGLHLNTEGAYSPEIFTISSHLKNYKMFSSQLEYELMPDVEIYTGYRYIKFDFDNRSYMTYDSNIFLGARFIF